MVKNATLGYPKAVLGTVLWADKDRKCLVGTTSGTMCGATLEKKDIGIKMEKQGKY